MSLELDRHTETDLDLSILEELDFEFEPGEGKCSLDGCDDTAAWNILCGRCGTGEEICNGHHAYFANNPEFYLAFTDACGHTIKVRKCRYIPIG